MTRQPLTLLLLVASLAGCAGPVGTPVPTDGVISTNQGGLVFDGGLGMPPGTEEGAAGSLTRGGAVPALAPGAAMAADAAIAPESAGLSVPSSQQEGLKAGAVDDNAAFAAYMAYLEGYRGRAMRTLDVSERRVIKVSDAAGRAVANAEVVVSRGETVLFRGKSYANGELLFHPKAAPGAEGATELQVKATKGDQTVSGRFERTAEGAWELKLGQVARSAAKLDVLFLIDATGSMGGEIRRLQDTIKTISERIRSLEAQPSVRFGLVAYRDQNEAYVTATADFTSRLADFQASLDQVQAEGGGDTPEDLEAGLSKAVEGVSWAADDTVRLVFLVADAAPHIDYPQSTPYTTSALRAAEKGVKIFPIGASGLAPEGEYAFRQLAQLTMGRYLFITRGGDQATAGQASATVDQYSEGRLDDIVVDLVEAELAHLAP